MSHILLTLIRLVNGGALLISLASIESKAYEYKRRVLKLAESDDLSVFGEDLSNRLQRLGVVFQKSLHNSYMDVRRMLNMEDEGLLNWTEYFCRLSMNQLGEIGKSKLLDTLLSVAVKFSDLPRSQKIEFQKAPAACGIPGPNSMILPHREMFFVIPCR